jgi:hypothetical protein
MTKKTKKKRFDPLFDFVRHPPSPFGHLTYVRLTIALLGLACILGANFAFEPTGAAQDSSVSHAHDFVVFATVLNDQGFALFGVRARIHRVEEKKYRWEAMSDHQGELGIRVPQNAEYELTIQAHGFETQTRRIDTRQGNRADLTIRMQPQTSPRTVKGSGGKS